MEIVAPIFSFKVGSLIIDSDIVFQWVIIIFLGIMSYFLTRKLKAKPTKIQVAIEYLYDLVSNVVKNNMGESYISFVPYIGSLMIYLLVMNLIGLIGIMPPTRDLNVTFALAFTSFVVIQYNAIKRNKFGGYLHGYAHPFAMMLPLNIMERVILPVSLALRLFGNMLAATILVELVYEALGHVAMVAQIGLPIFVHAYFDVFDGAIQMIVFVMLTMINIKITAEH